MKYTKLYSGGEPELIEGEIFRTIIPLGTNVPVGLMRSSSKDHGGSVTRKVTEVVTEKVTEGEADVLALILQNEELTQSEIATQLNVSRKTVSVRIRALKEKI